MTTSVVKAFKNIAIIFVLFFTIISCEKEIDSVGTNLIDNNSFIKDKLVAEVFSETVNVDRVPTNGSAQYLLGVYSDNEFGKLKASISTQLSLPTLEDFDDYNFGTNPGIDSVLLIIPYQSTRQENAEDGKPVFSIDSVFGNTDQSFLLNVYELKTFLNTLDPEDPTKPAIYYSDKEFQKSDTPLFSGEFKVNPNDTVAYVKRYLANQEVYDIDTVKQLDVRPFISIPLNELIMKQLLIDNSQSSYFDSSVEFQRYFRGLYLESQELLTEYAHIISLDLSSAKIALYYSNDEDEDAETDLDGDGVLGEQGVRVKHLFEFPFGSIRTNVFERDLVPPHQSGDDRLYVQGAAGSQAVLELFLNENIEQLQQNNWLITDAEIAFYVDQNASSDIVPEQIFLYDYDRSQQIQDMLSEGIFYVGGSLQRDEDGNPYRYVFKITDYISELLKADEPLELVKLGLKVYNPTDLPSDFTDFKVGDYSWTPKGVVLYNHDESAGDKRVQLKISYTEINN